MSSQGVGPARAPTYQVCLALGVVAILAYYALDGLTQDALYDVVRLGSAVVIFVGARRREPDSASWYLIALGQLFFGLGDVVWDVYKHVHHADPFPSLADGFYLAAYPALAVGVLLQVRRAFPGRDRTAVIDAAIIATGLGLVVWALLMQPTAHDPELRVSERVVLLGYPLMDVVLVAIGARLVFTRRMRTVASSLWDLGLISLLLADSAFLATQLAGTYRDGTLIDAAFLLSGVLWAASALQRTAVAPPRTVAIESSSGDAVSRGRVGVLFGVALIGPLLLGLQRAQGGWIDVAVALGGAAALMILVLLRITSTSVQRGVRNMALLAAAVGAFVTLSLNTVPALRFTYANSELRAAVETAQALIGFLVTHLLYLRFRRTRLLSDLLLVYGVGLLGAANLFLVVAVTSGREPGSSMFFTWAPLLTRVIAASAIVWAAWALPRRLTLSSVAPRMIAAHLFSLGAVASGVAAFEKSLPPGIPRGVDGLSSEGASVEGHPVILAAQLLLMALFWLGAGGFVHRSHDDPGPLTTALVAGFVLAGFSRLSFSLHPTLYTEIVDTGDFLRLGSYLVFLVGAGREIHSYWRGLARVAVSEERERTARELHDGLVQELSFIRSQTANLTSERASPRMLEQVALAVDRALQESRRAIGVLSGEIAEDPATALRRAAEEVAARSGIAVEYEARGIRDLSPSAVAPLSRIVREACWNAVRHGHPTLIVVCAESSKRGWIRLTVSDDGVGFDPEAAAGGSGFGISSMRQRAAALGGEFKLSSTRGRGTTVEVVIPRT